MVVIKGACPKNLYRKVGFKSLSDKKWNRSCCLIQNCKQYTLAYPSSYLDTTNENNYSNILSATKKIEKLK